MYGFREVAARNGGDATALLAACGIDPSRLDNPDHPVPGNAVAQLLDHAARTLEAPDFGLQLSEYHDASILGTVALLVLNSDTVGAALDAIASNIQFHNPGAKVQVIADASDGLARYDHDPGIGEGFPRRQAIELIYAIAFRFLRTLTNSDGAGWRVQFRHSRGMRLQRYRHYFTCPIEFGCARDRILVPVPLLALKIDRADPALRALAAKYLAQLERRYPSNLEHQVRELVRRQLPNGGGHVARIAAILGLHPKTLQRRLRQENTTFQRIADDVRRSLAAEYLVFSFLPLSEVAGLVGYSGQTAFIVSCRRWFGVTPKRYRTEFLQRRDANRLTLDPAGSPTRYRTP